MPAIPPDPGITAKILQVIGDLHVLAPAPTRAGVAQAITDLQSVLGQMPPDPAADEPTDDGTATPPNPG